MTDPALISDEAVKDILGMIREEADGWRAAVDGRERDPVEEAGFLDAIAKTIEALVKRREAERASDLREALQGLVDFIKTTKVGVTHGLSTRERGSLIESLHRANTVLLSTGKTA